MGSFEIFPLAKRKNAAVFFSFLFKHVSMDRNNGKLMRNKRQFIQIFHNGKGTEKQAQMSIKITSKHVRTSYAVASRIPSHCFQCHFC